MRILIDGKAKLGASVISGGTLDDCIIGSITPAAGSFTTGSFAGLLSQIGLGYSTFVGFNAGSSDDLSNNYNTGIGYEAAQYTSTGAYNTALGMQALRYNTVGNQNVGLGMQALHWNDAGSRNIAIGYYSGFYELGSDSFYVNNRDRTTTANEKLTSIIYGIMAAAVADQHLTFNANVKINGMTGLNNVTPVGKAAHIADPTDLATCITAINAILVVLENLGAVATA